MADLSTKDATTPVIIVGSTPTGLETTPIAATDSGEIKSADLMNVNAVQASLSVTGTAIVARAGASNLPNRKMVILQCNSNNITYGFNSSAQPFSLPRGTTLYLSIGENVTLYLRSTGGTGTVIVAELS